MTSDRRDKGSHRIPIKFTDADEETRSADEMDRQDPDNQGEDALSDADYDFTTEDLFGSGDGRNCRWTGYGGTDRDPR